MDSDSIVDAVKAALVVELGLDYLSDYAIRSLVMLTMQVCDDNGLMVSE